MRARALFRSWRRRAGGRRAPPSGRGRFDRNSFFMDTQSRPGRVIERSRAAVDTQQLFSSRIELAHLRKPRVRIRPRPLDLRPPVSRLVQPPRLSLRVPSCVVCRGQSHGRGGSRIAIFITARGSGATRARRLARRCVPLVILSRPSDGQVSLQGLSAYLLFMN